ncbi:MAG: lysophospholipid acyltransferase family protein [Granulosicoccaceae bacterium]|jgi:1-acyl-sn-glycerol-3-phosphate acyltransferase
MATWQLVLLAVFLFILVCFWLFRRCERYAQADWGRPWLNRLDGLNRLFCRHVHRLQHDDIPLPESGPALLVCNHVSGLEPLLMIAAARRPLRFLIAREEYERVGLQWLFRAIGAIPVERKGRPEVALREARRALENGEVVMLFPHGSIHLDSDPPRKLKGGVAVLARLTGAPVIPLRVTGITGEGYTVRAVFMRSHARLRSFAPIACAELDTAGCLARIAPLIEGRTEQAQT